jgi:hypothetical protein
MTTNVSLLFPEVSVRLVDAPTLHEKVQQVDVGESVQSGRKSSKERLRQDIEAAIEAIKRDDLNALSKLVKTAKQANWRRKDRPWSLLDQAVSSRSFSMVKWLVEKGANPNTVFFRDKPCDDRKGLCPGMYFSPFASAISFNQMEIALFLFASGADINIPMYRCSVEGLTTCRDVAEYLGLWSYMEAHLISQAVGANAAHARNCKRL